MCHQVIISIFVTGQLLLYFTCRTILCLPKLLNTKLAMFAPTACRAPAVDGCCTTWRHMPLSKTVAE